MVERPANPVQVAEQLAKNIALLLITRSVAALDDGEDRITQDFHLAFRRHAISEHGKPIGAETDVNTSAKRINDIADLDAILMELGAVSGSAAVAPGAFWLRDNREAIAVKRRPFGQAIGMDGDIVRLQPQRFQKFQPEVYGFADAHLAKREKPKHGEMQEVGAVSDFIEIAQAETGLAVCDCSHMVGIGEEGFVLLHTSAAEERGVIMRPYGLKTCEVDAF